MDARLLSFSVLTRSRRMLLSLQCIFQVYLSFCSYTWSSLLHLELDAASRQIVSLHTAPACSPGGPRPPCKQLPAQLSEVLLVACSLIKNLQRPLTAYTAKSQPVCLSVKSLRYHCLCAPSISILTGSPNDPTLMTDLLTSCSACSPAAHKLCLCPK